jgi:[acyl-carrier-protein] S-malonyltransferase
VVSKIAFIFPGQGSQAVGMGIALAEKYPLVRNYFTQASELLGFDLFAVCKEGPEERLRQTNIAQPALFVTGVATAELVKSLGITPHGVAGHSIGEYAALVIAQVFNFTESLKLVRERGRLMQEAASAHSGAMAAVLGLSYEQAKTVCAEAAEGEVCLPVNFNSPEQIVVAGHKGAVERFNAMAPQKGAKRVIPLNVAGAFHSPLMKEAAVQMQAVLEQTQFHEASVPVAMNVDGVLRTRAEEIRSALIKQLDSPVLWVAAIEHLRAAGCDRFIEMGSGRVLSGLLRRIDRALEGYSTDTVEAVLEATRVSTLSGRENA